MSSIIDDKNKTIYAIKESVGGKTKFLTLLKN